MCGVVRNGIATVSRRWRLETKRRRCIRSSPDSHVFILSQASREGYRYPLMSRVNKAGVCRIAPGSYDVGVGGGQTAFTSWITTELVVRGWTKAPE